MTDKIPDGPGELLAYLSERNLSDGLPVVPPTEARIKRMLTRTSKDPDEVLLELPPTFTELTVEALAQCAVMAGCRPDYFPVVETAFDALAEWTNLRGIVATTSGFAVAELVNGPIRDELEINSGTGVFGPGYRANATIGRAVNLAFMMVGEMYPGTGTMATHAHQGRYTYCFAENEEESPWEPFHTDFAGLDPDTSAVTVKSAQVPHLTNEEEIREYGANDPMPDEILEAITRKAINAATTGSNHPGEIMIVTGPDHALRLSDGYSKRAIKEHLYDHCRWRGETRMVRSPEDVHVVVAGGPERWTSVIHSHSYSENFAVTKPIPAA